MVPFGSMFTLKLTRLNYIAFIAAAVSHQNFDWRKFSILSGGGIRVKLFSFFGFLVSKTRQGQIESNPNESTWFRKEENNESIGAPDFCGRVGLAKTKIKIDSIRERHLFLLDPFIIPVELNALNSDRFVAHRSFPRDGT